MQAKQLWNALLYFENCQMQGWQYDTYMNWNKVAWLVQKNGNNASTCRLE